MELERPIGYHFLGLGLSVVGSILIPVGVIYQKQSHDRGGRGRAVVRDVNTSKKKTAMLSDRRWWFGLALFILGNLFTFGAFAFLPSFVVTVIGAFSLVVNLILSHRCAELRSKSA
jgi:hypothetical protein